MIRILTLVVLLAVSVYGGQKCWDRKENRNIRDLVRKVSCMEPRKTLVPLPVPKGFDRVYPSVVEVPRCAGQMCIQLDQECVATETKNMTITVEAHRLNSLMEHECVDISVQEDVMCGCNCERSQESCGINKVFNRNFCRCECKQGLKNECKNKMVENPGLFMWDETSCTCPCNNQHVKCGDGQVFVHETCECRYVMES
ncbi:vascular endothelial growth factor A-A [Penaeus vannamei]|uniref:PDGF/VEGF-related factor 1 n=1 Tax=Penaeus vannamei TaxID=6689 RepID=A0A3G2KWW0_PENVA|nr:balbiani ring protein 3-like [Penaeus vannamei]AYN64309.1 vascular endothelial growth factor 4 [Penaeus vannamei]ROT85909.1 PDGF/VEGF-related factor 1 [Penaeus vannamei]